MNRNKRNVNLKSIFRTCQKKAEKFKYNAVLTQEDLIHNAFWFNAKKIPEVTEFKTTYYKPLATKKDISLDMFHETYWNELRKKFNESPSDIETLKKFMLETLEKKLFPTYFNQTKFLFHHFFNSDYSPELFKNNSTNIFKLLTAFYIGDYAMIEERLQWGFPGAKLFDKKITGYKTFCEQLKSILLEIWDQHVKLTNVIQFPIYALHLNTSSQKPILQIPDYNTVTNGEKDKRGIHNKENEILPEPELYEKAKELYQKEGNKCLSKDDPRFPSEWMKDKLTGKSSNIELIGYKKKDVNKENPIKLKKGIIRKYLGMHNHKWIISE